MRCGMRLDQRVLLEGGAGLLGLRQAELPAERSLSPNGANRSANSLSLPALWLATTIVLARSSGVIGSPQILGSANSIELPDGSRK